jgi:hypothetical protein
MRIEQQRYAYKHYNQEIRSKKFVQLLNRRNVLNMQDQISNQRELKKFLSDTNKFNIFLNKA